jgi:hypothetical protein
MVNEHIADFAENQGVGDISLEEVQLKIMAIGQCNGEKGSRKVAKAQSRKGREGNQEIRNRHQETNVAIRIKVLVRQNTT